MENMAKIMIGIGFTILITGIIVLALAKLGGSGFKLPGDIYIKKGNFSFYFPVVTCLIISLILSLIFNLIGRR